MAMTATKAFDAVQKTVEAIRCDTPQRFPEAANVGECVRQGDLYIELLSGVPDGCKPAKKSNTQLAPGTTQGSRHILDSMEGVTVYSRESATVLDGPVLLLKKERVVTHPEHGDWILPPGCYGITYQRAYAEELRRVAD